MKKESLNKYFTFLIAAVWFVNGFVCKVLNLVPRHEQIVARILGGDYSRIYTILIGLSEIIMAVWVLTKYKSKINAILQITVILSMNFLEFMLVPDLLLWGRMNFFFALMFVFVIYYNEFVLINHLHRRIRE